MSTVPRLSSTALALAALLALTGVTSAHAQGEPIGVPLNAPPPNAYPPNAQPPQPVPGDPADPPGTVGRISDMSGQVWLFHPDSGEWVTAQRNLPLTTGDRIATDAGARAEVRIGSSVVRLDGGTELEALKLDDEHLALQLHNGSAAVRLRNRDAVRDFELRTAEGRFTAQRTGRYRFDRDGDHSNVTVYAGQALYEGPGSALTVNASQRAEFFLDGAGAAQYTITDPQRDAFANWAADRDRADERSASARYVSPEMTGVEDLDRNGSWQQSPEYGALWTPTVVAAGWAPYTTGRWAWVSPWGWTWVDEAPWGFAPFHYGRWVNYNNRWCWAPGTYVQRPVYAPALVAWVGGPRLSVSVSIGGPVQPAVGWVPLAPREVYVPSYRVSPGYVRNVNVTHVTNITNITTIVNNPQQAVRDRDYQNRKYPNAVTVVPTAALTERRSIAPIAATVRQAPQVREIVERPNREAMIAAPLAPTVRRVDAIPTPPPGTRVEPPRGGARYGPQDRGTDRPGQPDRPAQADRPGQPERPGRDVRPVAPQTAGPAAPVAPQVVAPAAPAAPVVRQPQPQQPPQQPRTVVAPVPPPQQPPAAAPRPPVRQPEVRPPEVRQPEVRRPPEVRQPEVRRPEVRAPERVPEVRAPEARPAPPQARPEVRQVQPVYQNRTQQPEARREERRDDRRDDRRDERPGGRNRSDN